MPKVPARRAWRWLRRGLIITLAVVAAYVILAYGLLPLLWRHYEHHPALQQAPKTAFTAEGIAADPLNVALAGTEEEVVRVMLAAAWRPADAETLRSALHIAESVLLRRPYPSAPVSRMYLWGRRHDLAFEQPAAKSPSQRHHVRFWRSEELGIGGRPLWIGAATFDRSVGFNHRTGQMTHHIAPDVDAERDKLVSDLRATGQLASLFQVTGVGATLNGRNGARDWYFTDGELTVCLIRENNATSGPELVELSNPPVVQIKDQLWHWIRGANPTLDPPLPESRP